MFGTRTQAGRVEVVFTDREGGVSSGPWTSLNLGTDNGDEPDDVARNLEIVTSQLDVERLVRMSQVHGNDVHVVDDRDTAIPAADGLVTSMPGTGLLVRVADCLPVVLADPEAGVVAVAHAGRKGLQLGVVPRTIDSMRELGGRSIRAWLGPRACGRCYEIPQALADEVAAVVPAARATTSWGTAALDIGAGVSAQLSAQGIEFDDLGGCTIEDEALFSYRRQGIRSGRFGAAVVLR